MKSTLAIFLTLILAFGCAKNDFENTQLYLEFDKGIYHLNDIFQLTIKVSPTETEETIRFHKDFRNIEISFLSKETSQNGLTQITKDPFIEKPNLAGNDGESIHQYYYDRKTL